MNWLKLCLFSAVMYCGANVLLAQPPPPPTPPGGGWWCHTFRPYFGIFTSSRWSLCYEKVLLRQKKGKRVV